MGPEPPRPPLELTGDQARSLTEWAGGPRTPQALALRARIVLACADGGTNETVAADLGVTEQTVAKWRQRFEAHGIEGLHDAARSGAPRRNDVETLEWVLALTLLTTPADGSRWTTRSMSRASGLSQSAISRAWRGFGLNPSSRSADVQRNNRLIGARFEDLLRLHLDAELRGRVRVHRVRSRAALREWLAEQRGDRADLVLADCQAGDEDEARAWLERHPQFTLRLVPPGKHWGELVEHWFRGEHSTEPHPGVLRLALASGPA